MTGIEATLKIREFVRNQRHLVQPKIICYSTSNYKDNFKEHGFDGFMNKPFGISELKKILTIQNQPFERSEDTQKRFASSLNPRGRCFVSCSSRNIYK